MVLCDETHAILPSVLQRTSSGDGRILIDSNIILKYLSKISAWRLEADELCVSGSDVASMEPM